MRLARATVWLPISVAVALSLLSSSPAAHAQAIQGKTIDVHENVKLVILPVAAELPEDLRTKYDHFLPLAEEVVKASTSPEPPECFLTIRLASGVKEIGAAKTKRAYARFTAFRRNSKDAYVGRIYLHSFVTNSSVNKDEITDFLTKRILGPAKCTAELTSN